MSASSRDLLRAALEKEAQIPRLGDVLGGRSFFSYALYRTRLLPARAGLKLALRGIEIVLLSTVLPFELLGPYFFLQGVAWLISSLGFGYLEETRVFVQAAYRERRYADIFRARRTLLRDAGGLALLFLGLAGGWMLLDPAEISGFDVFDAFALALALRLSLEAWVRAYHAPIAALRRIRRPLFSFLLADSLEPLLLLALFPTLGLFSFSIAHLAGGLLGSYLSFHYTRLAYQRAHFARGTKPRAARKRNLRELGRAALGAIAQLSLQTDLLLLLLFSRSGEPLLGLTIYLARPLWSAALSAARSFYLDLKHRGTQSKLGEQRLQRLLAEFSALSGFVLGLILALIAWLLGVRDPRVLALLPPLSVARNLLGARQSVAIAEGEFRVLLLMLAAFAALSLLLFQLPPSTLAAPFTLLLLTVALFALARWPRQRPSGLGFLPWRSFLRLLHHDARSGVLVQAQVMRRPRPSLEPLTAALIREYPSAHFTWLTRDRLALWWPKAPLRGRFLGKNSQGDHPESPQVLRPEIAAFARGLLRDIQVTEHAEGAPALASMRLPEEWRTRLDQALTLPLVFPNDLVKKRTGLSYRALGESTASEPTPPTGLEAPQGSIALVRSTRPPEGHIAMAFPDPVFAEGEWIVSRDLSESERAALRAELELISLAYALRRPPP